MSNAPHRTTLPRLIDPRKFAHQALDLTGPMAIKDLTRLRQALVDDDGEVAVDLMFGFDEQKLRVAKGTLHATV